jgi:hypothetical protein
MSQAAHFSWVPGENRVCRGANPNDNKPEYYTVLQGIGTLQLCKAQCASTVARLQGLAKDQIIGIRKMIQLRQCSLCFNKNEQVEITIQGLRVRMFYLTI